MTKKIVLIGVAAFLVASVVLAQNSRVAYSGSGSGSAATTIVVPAGSGVPLAKSFNYSIATSATVTVYRPDIQAVTHSAVVGSTNVYIFVDNVTTQIQGYTLTTSDSLVFPASGSSNAALCGIAAITTTGSTTNGYIKVELDAAPVANAASNGVVFIAKNSKTQSIALGTTASTGNEGVWVGYDRCPVVISIPATAGAVVLSGVVEYW